MKKNIGIIITVAVVVVGVYYFYAQSRNLPKVEEPLDAQKIIEEEAANRYSAPLWEMIVYNDSGFKPNFVTVEKGGKIMFKNESLKPMWVAAGKHPTHTDYPGTDIEKCGTEEEAVLFDMCKSVSQGSEWSFAFDETGEWRFHNHLNASHFGIVKVVE